MRSFYLTLPSRGGTDNTTSSFTVELPYEIDLSGEWEVGVVEVLYPTTWHNIYERNNLVQICYGGNNMIGPECWDGQKMNFANFYIEPDYYDKPEAIINQINYFVTQFFKKDLAPFVVDRRGYVNWHPTNDATVKIHKDVADILGLENVIFAYDESKGKLQPNHNIQNLYVYTDLIEPQIVGSARADLLCIIPAGERNLKAAHFSPSHIHYLPLVRNNFTHVQIHIRDVAGEQIAFASGHSVVKLHFKPVDANQ